MAVASQETQNPSQLWQAHICRLFRWITTPHVILSIIMIAVMFYLVIIPLHRMLVTTITVADIDLRVLRDVEARDLTLYHWIRMLTGQIGKVMTYEPLVHSVTVALGATFLTLAIGGLMAWLVCRTDIPGRETIHMLAQVHYIMPSWISPRHGWCFSRTRNLGGTMGLMEFIPAHRHLTGCVQRRSLQ